MAKVSINIVTYNGQKWLGKCLDSVLKQTWPDFEIVIIDNASNDGTKEFLREYFKDKNFSVSLGFKTQAREGQVKHTIIFNDKNLGFASGHNQAINASTSEYVLCLNQDIILEPDYLERLVEFMDKNREAGAVSGKLLVWDDKHDKRTDIIDSLGLEIKKSWQVVERGAGLSAFAPSTSSGASADEEKIFGVSATAALYRRKALEEIKFNEEYFDELFFCFKEDIDLAFRLRKKGWQNWLVPRAKAYHVRTAFYRGQGSELDIAKARKEKSPQVNYWSYRNHWYLLIKHLDWPEFKKNFAWIVPYEFKKLVYVLLFEWGSLRAFKDIVKNWQRLMEARRKLGN